MRTADFLNSVCCSHSAVLVLHWPVWEMLSFQLAIWRLRGIVGNWVKVASNHSPFFMIFLKQNGANHFIIFIWNFRFSHVNVMYTGFVCVQMLFGRVWETVSVKRRLGTRHKMQTADCRLWVKRRLSAKWRMRTADFLQSVRSPQSAVRSPQSAVHSLQSSFYTDLFERCYRFNWAFGGCMGLWATGWKFVPSNKFKLQLDAASSQAPVETWNFQCYSWMTLIYLLNL